MLRENTEPLKEKLMMLLEENGINAEMGLTPAKTVYVMHWEKETDTRDYWFVESEDGVKGKVPWFAAMCLEYYLFACVRDEDYENGRYMTGRFEDLKARLTPEGLDLTEKDMDLSFQELMETLR